ncbi:Ig-like domain-containing protein [Nocardioides hankookensis]|uniref:Ig-like domain-containing protein n=1 Tax=Nocardioides hankookensis TaxID=443157 RepID=A0ABW1LDE1_9ACTN
MGLGIGSVCVVVGVQGGGAPAYADYASSCASPDRTLSGDHAASFSVAPGETLRLTGGEFTGGIDSFPAGSTLCVASSAVLAPPYLNNAAGSLVVASGGEVRLTSVAVAAGFSLENEGTFRASTLNINGAAELANARGATFRVDGNFSPGNGSIVNRGVMVLAGGANLNGAVRLDNHRALRVTGSMTSNGIFQNSGVAQVSGGLTVNGSGTFVNRCVVDVGGALANNGPRSASSGIALVGGQFGNNGTWVQTGTAVLGAASLTNDGSITGLGRYLFTGDTRTQGTFRGASAQSPIVVDDRTPPTPPQIFDTQSGAVENVVAGTVGRPTASTRVPGCDASVDPSRHADVETTKTAPLLVQPGDPVLFRITVTNHGDDAADDVAVTDALPGNLVAPVVASDGGVVAGGQVTWDLGTVASGATRELTVSGSAPASGRLLNSVSSTSSTDDPDATNNDGSAPTANTTTIVVPTITPPPLPDAPDYVRSTYTGLPVVGSPPANGDDVRYSVVTPPSHGTLTLTGGGAVSYRSDGDFTGVDTFVYQACDGALVRRCASGTVTINVLPVALPDRAATTRGRPVAIPVLDNDTDGAPVSGTSDGPSHGSVVVRADGTIVYRPDAGFTGTDTFRYQICSPTEPTFCSSARVRVTVSAPNHPPTLAGELLVTDTGSPVTGRVVGTDPDGDALTYSRGTAAVHGTAVVLDDGSVVYRPSAGYAGHDVFSAVVCDDGTPSLCADALVRVRVFPIAVDDHDSTRRDTPVTVDVVANDAGRHRPPEVADAPRHGSVEADGDALVYTPDDGFLGADTFTYRLCTPGLDPLCRTATVTIDVTISGDLPDTGGGGDGDGAGAAGGGGSGVLPGAGGPDVRLLLGGGLLLACGGALVVAGRRRRT